MQCKCKGYLLCLNRLSRTITLYTLVKNVPEGIRLLRETLCELHMSENTENNRSIRKIDETKAYTSGTSSLALTLTVTMRHVAEIKHGDEFDVYFNFKTGDIILKKKEKK